MSDVSRNPSDYHPTTHAIDRRKARGIEWDKVGETIRAGEVTPSHKEQCVVFKHQFPDDSNPVGVVANIDSGHVLTIEYRKD